RLAHALKMEFGNHTFSHPNLQTLSEPDIQSEIDRVDELLQKVDGKPRHLFRAPFGRIDERVKQAVQTPVIDWTIDTLDWTGLDAQTIYDTVWTQKFAGAIVLMHDGYENTVEALKRLLPDLYAAGYQVASVSAMAKAHACPLRRGSVYIRARKKAGV
ncbi:MAG: polysaccharide deacetylase family protein, partial [Clostridia bacterium]|nr:polysaccharide deacetylase family protein [Clostridia bacterium]